VLRGQGALGRRPEAFTSRPAGPLTPSVRTEGGDRRRSTPGGSHAHAHTSYPASRRHHALGRLGFLAAADHAVASREQTTADAALRRLLARERSSIPNGDPAQALPTGPVQPAERDGQPVVAAMTHTICP
jgi:hypothetical protein